MTNYYNKIIEYILKKIILLVKSLIKFSFTLLNIQRIKNLSRAIIFIINTNNCKKNKFSNEYFHREIYFKKDINQRALVSLNICKCNIRQISKA